MVTDCDFGPVQSGKS